MVIDRRLMSQTLLYACLGGAAGLFVCAILIWAVEGIWSTGPDRMLTADMAWALKSQTILLFYMVLGLVTGFVVMLIEPVNDSSLKEAFASQWRWLLLGGLFGAAGMVLGGFAGEWVFDRMVSAGQGGSKAMTILGRELGMLVLGLGLGAGIGLVDRFRTGSMDRFVAGLIGGSVGGLLAAAVFQFVIPIPEAMPVFPTILLACFAAGAIGSVSMAKTDAVLIGVPGNKIFKYASDMWRKQLASDALNYVGSGLPGRRSRQATFQIANDLDVVSEHAVIKYDKSSRRWMLNRWSPDAVKLLVNRRALAGDAVALRDGDLVTFGGTQFRFVLTK